MLTPVAWVPGWAGRRFHEIVTRCGPAIASTAGRPEPMTLSATRRVGTAAVDVASSSVAVAGSKMLGETAFGRGVTVTVQLAAGAIVAPVHVLAVIANQVGLVPASDAVL